MLGVRGGRDQGSGRGDEGRGRNKRGCCEEQKMRTRFEHQVALKRLLRTYGSCTRRNRSHETILQL